MELSAVVSRNPEVHSGELVFAGTRVPVHSLVEHISAGISLDEFLMDFPTVSREQAVAFLDFAVIEVDRARAA